MSDRDRRIIRESWKSSFPSVEAKIHGNIEIDKGDLMFLDRWDGLRDKGTSTADWYAYPFSKISGSTVSLASNRDLAGDNFIGVAAWHSDSGVTEKIGIYIKGLFSYPLKNARHLRTRRNVIAAGSGVTLFSQKVAVVSSSSTHCIGLVAKPGDFKSVVEMNILTLFFGNVDQI